MSDTPSKDSPDIGGKSPGAKSDTPSKWSPDTGGMSPGTKSDTPSKGLPDTGGISPGTKSETPSIESPDTGGKSPGAKSDTPSKDSPDIGGKSPGAKSDTPSKGSPDTGGISPGTKSDTPSIESPDTGGNSPSSEMPPTANELLDDKETVANNPALPENEDVEDAELMERMRGDAVGNTLYSERFILKTILSLMSPEKSQEEFEQLEKDLCSVWDMTIEEDVAELLIKEDFLAILMHVLDSTENLRLIEILVGMLGNICCHECGFKSLTKDPMVVEMLFRLTTCMDSHILIQLMRSLGTVMSKLKPCISDEGKTWYGYIGSFDEFAQNFAFILKMCKVGDVLKGCLKALNAILVICCLVEEKIQDTNDDNADDDAKLRKFGDIFLNAELIDGTNMAFCYLMRISDTSHDDDDDDDDGSDEQSFETMNENIQVYINIHSILAQNEDSIRCYEDHTTEMTKCLAFILNYYTNREDLMILPKEDLTFIEGIIHIQNCLNNPFHIYLFNTTLKLWRIFNTYLGNLTQNPGKFFNEFVSNDLSPEIYAHNCELLLKFLADMLKGCNIELWKSSLLKTPRKEILILLNAFDAVTDKSDFRLAASKLRSSVTVSKYNTNEPDEDYFY